MGLGGADQLFMSRRAVLGETEIITVGFHDPGIRQLAKGLQPTIRDSQAQALREVEARQGRIWTA